MAAVQNFDKIKNNENAAFDNQEIMVENLERKIPGYKNTEVGKLENRNMESFDKFNVKNHQRVADTEFKLNKAEKQTKSEVKKAETDVQKG